MRSSHSLDRLEVIFDDDHAVADAGLLLPATLAQHLGLRQLIDDSVDLGGAVGHANVGHKAMTLIHSALAGGDCIGDADALRAGSTQAVLGHAVLAPSTLGTFLRSFTWGHARQLDAVAGELLARAWAAGAGPGDAPFTIDVDSSIHETYGLAKQGGVFGHTKVRGYHPLYAVAAGTGDVLGCRLRGGNAHTGRGAAGFVTETVNRVRAAGASGPLTLRADSGFYAGNVVTACRKADVRFSITVKMNKGIRAAIAAIPEDAWTSIPYFLDGADVAETTYRPFGKKQPLVRLVVRRTKPTPGSQLALLVTYDYHAFITDRELGTVDADADHRRHADVENVIRDLKYGVGLNHLPSGRFGANAAWLALNVIAHNLSRWVGRIGLGETVITHKTLRRRYLDPPGRLTRSGGKLTLHLPQRWPWANGFRTALANLRAVVLVT
ncbi:MAG: IS1380 family transposase [Acidimicrobiales bacterium]